MIHVKDTLVSPMRLNEGGNLWDDNWFVVNWIKINEIILIYIKILEINSTKYI
jgi:hypothetical protein